MKKCAGCLPLAVALVCAVAATCFAVLFIGAGLAVPFVVLLAAIKFLLGGV